MKKLFLLGALMGASALVSVFSGSALAVTDQNVVVAISGARDTDASWHNFPGPVRSVTFVSPGNDVDCDAVTVHYADDGASRAIFSGMLYAGERQTVSFPARRIRDIRFLCHADNAGGASLDLTADMVGWAPVHETSFVAPMASQSFGRWDDHSVMIGDSPDLRAIALQPEGADARCHNVTASFIDGSSANLPVNDGRTMREGDVYRVRVNGQNRGLDALGLSCEAQNGQAVTIKIYGVG